MYNAKRTDTYFRGELNKFIQVVEKHIRNDCHVLLMMFLPIAIRAIKTVYVKMVTTRLCYFIRISQKVYKNLLMETMARLEMCFPPGHFDITKHLMIHIVD